MQCDNKTLYYEIKDLTLIAKEFRYHTENTLVPNISRAIMNQFMKKDIIRSVGLREKSSDRTASVSLCVLHEIYGLSFNDTRYRNKLNPSIGAREKKIWEGRPAIARKFFDFARKNKLIITTVFL